MDNFSRGFRLSLGVLLVLDIFCSLAVLAHGNRIKSATFLSPLFVLGPGSVENRYYFDIDFPRGHIGIKSFNGEVVDEAGNAIPLHETYLHHWVVAKYYRRKDSASGEDSDEQRIHPKGYIFAGNSGICQGSVLGQYFGLGSETRRTATYVPDPYGIESGNPAEIPEGHEEMWMLNIHAIDTRGVEDRFGWNECRCDLYNVTVDEYSRPLPEDYIGGLRCCYDHTQCKVKHGFEGPRRNLYLRYTMMWVDWYSQVLPVKIFIFDVTDSGKRLNGSTTLDEQSGCRVEYDVESCSAGHLGGDECIDAKKTSLIMPTGGYVVYGVAHQHTGGIGSTLYGKDGRVLCTSTPIYGEGEEAGNETGYIVGMSTCYPKPGSVSVAEGETLVLESNYTKAAVTHTGVMGLFYILVAEELPTTTPLLDSSIHAHEEAKLTTYSGAVVLLLGLAITIAVAVYSFAKNGREDDYEPVVA